jgi:hypothetical protein
MAYAKHTVLLKAYSDVFEEFLAGGVIIPGMLVLQDSSNEVVAHNDDAPAFFAPLIALEDDLEGKGIDDAYAEGDPVKCWTPYRGDQFYGILADGEHVAVGDFLESDGAGLLQKATSGHAVGIAQEHLDLSGSDSSAAPDPNNPLSVLGYNRRIRVKVI